ncbi:2-dehydropantoate 2-reductase [Mycobacterium tuberculosis CAS/NITR204]|uniref:2-dehydropantoate 2-reductase n=1 Tax=Mycobacterium tuberculosis CAS/NITR204 TaxID=1310114 RepID=R4MGJ4_MYCTX|nr:2-dehydropantoate 2-reductase [Mycobacterium tuberculosis CAS/NITR204]
MRPHSARRDRAPARRRRPHRGARSGAHQSSGGCRPGRCADPGGQGHSERSPQSLAALCDERPWWPCANGVEQVEQVQPHCPSSAVVPAIVWCSAETQPQGWVRLRGEAALVVPTGPAAEQFAGLLRGAKPRWTATPTSPRRPGANYWSTRWRDLWCCPDGGRQCSAATTSRHCRAAMSPNAWRWRALRVPDSMTTSSTKWSASSGRPRRTWAPRCWPTGQPTGHWNGICAMG